MSAVLDNTAPTTKRAIFMSAAIAGVAIYNNSRKKRRHKKSR